MARTRGLHYSLSSSGPIKWNSNQEASLLQELTPFSPNFDSRSVTSLCEQAREIYLQFLWLPEALMPLSQFIPLLQLLVRDAPSTSSSTHPLHSAIDEILLTGRWCAYKYHDKLPSVLAHAAGPDLEEQIMAFVASRHVEEDTSGSTGGEDPKRRWLLSVEQREVQIQILLHLLKLSLPGPCPELPIRPLPAPPRSQKRRRVQHSSSDEDASTPKDILEERLEALMDRLVLWQIGLPNPEDDAAPSGVSQPLRDWTQIFCDDIVQPLFAKKLPELYRLFRMKLFRIPQWSSSSEHSDSPDSPPSVAPSVAPTRSGTLTTLSRSRSRSLSVSLTQEAEAKRAGSKRRVLQREVSMSKVFKGKRRDSDVREAVREPPLVKAAEPQGPVILVAGTPMKPKKGKASANGRIGGIGAAKVLVAGTPAKTGGSRASAIASEDDGDESDDVAMPRWPGV